MKIEKVTQEETQDRLQKIYEFIFDESFDDEHNSDITKLRDIWNGGKITEEQLEILRMGIK